MLSGVALRAQIASVIDALSKAAVAEISKVVEDGMVVLRMEVCQRDDEIKKLKSSVEVLHNELRVAQKAATLLPDDHRGADESQSRAGDGRNPLEKTDDSRTSPPVPEVQVKCEPAAGKHEKARRQHDKVGEEFLYEAGQWRPRTQGETACSSSDNLTLEQSSLPRLSGSSLAGGMAVSHCSSGGFQQNPLGRGTLGFSQHRNTMWRRTVKRLMFKKGFICPYCGKNFERSGHLERHKRIHTGEKPYLCEICGRQFNQKCSLKEHMKIHRRYLQSRPGEIQVGPLNQTPEVNPRADTHQPEDGGQARRLSQGEDTAAKSDDVLPTPVQIKSEPAEETITQPLSNGGNEKTTDKGDKLRENFPAAEGNNQLWMPGLQNNPEMSGTEVVPSSSQSMTSFPGLAQPLPPPVAPSTSCSSFSFPGKPYSELKNSPLPQMPYGSTDTVIMSSEAGLRGVPQTLANHQQQRRSRSFQVVKPKKWFICSYCGKIFERAGHLERHLRIHTGEKPYGCHICGRCFNQKSSLKGHMRTHRNGEIPDVLEAHHLMFSVPDNQLLEKFVEPPNGQAAVQELLPGPAYGDTLQEEKMTVKTEPRGEDFLNQMGANNSSEVPENIHLWTSSMEKSSAAPDQTVCILLQDVKYLSPTANEQHGYLSSVKDLAFMNDKEKEAMMHSDQYSFLGGQPRNSDLTLVPEPHEVAVNDYGSVSGGTHEGSGLEFTMTASDSQEDNYGGGVTRQNGYICSNCGQSFDSFNMFQEHQCEKMPEQGSSAGLFSCEICGKAFNQMSILKLHLKLHVN